MAMDAAIIGDYNPNRRIQQTALEPPIAVHIMSNRLLNKNPQE
ncbi:hypothetical protein [Cellvibrio polysaccharolyticus]|nr:hypothetical protein [Cellvibrio polysaccharolyticus]